MTDKLVFQLNDTVQVFRLGKTSNKKIASPNEKIVQSYSFSKAQYQYVHDNYFGKIKNNFNEFFALDGSNCLTCPLSGNIRKSDTSLKVKCYTHKAFQYMGFISMLKGIIKKYGDFNNLPIYNSNIDEFKKMSKNRFVRFGTYGEPSLHPIELVNGISKVCKNWTGYTHQYKNKPLYSTFFMASTHSEAQSNKAWNDHKYRSFISYHDKALLTAGIIKKAVQCPASKELDVSNCSNCGLCSGTNGKGLKDVKILLH